MPRTEYPVELILSFDDQAVTISHGTEHGAGVYSYNLNELDPSVLDRLIGISDDVVVYTQGEVYSREDFEAVFGSADLSTMIRIHEGEY